MKKIMILTALLAAGMFVSAGVEAASETAADSAGGKKAARPGKEIRRMDRNGYTLTYYLLDLSERGEMVKLMGHHTVIGLSKNPDVTNHLMVYIEKRDGKIVPGDVAYLLTGPDGKDFKTMTMGMYGGYGADVIMKLKGVYTIRTKIALEGGDAVKLDDEFSFKVK